MSFRVQKKWKSESLKFVLCLARDAEGATFAAVCPNQEGETRSRRTSVTEVYSRWHDGTETTAGALFAQHKKRIGRELSLRIVKTVHPIHPAAMTLAALSSNISSDATLQEHTQPELALKTSESEESCARLEASIQAVENDVRNPRSFR